MTSPQTKTIIRTAVIATLALLAVGSYSDGDAADPVDGDYLCSIGADGEEVCETPYLETDADQDGSYDEIKDDDVYWYSVEGCTDHDEECESLAEKVQCESNPGFMKYECAASCGTCSDLDAAYEALRVGSGDGPCTDKYVECKNWAAMGECGFNPDFMLMECQRSCIVCFEDTNQFGLHQTLPPEDDEYHMQTKEVIEKSIEYMRRIWLPSSENDRINYKCRNMHEECSLWAVNECEEEHPESEYMQSNCAPACQTCHLLDTRLRCPIEEGNLLVMDPGGLNALFEKIVDDPVGTREFLKYQPKALSRPKSKADGTAAMGVEKDGPWVVILENFITDEEAEAMIAAGAKQGYGRSSDVGVENPDGTHEDEVSNGRTSHNSWCDEELCNKDPIIGAVINRIAALTETTPEHSEYLQLLRYEPGQYYERHHDYIEYQQGMPCGVRMLTLFLYLNDVEEGGGTRFPLLDITVQPRKGGALLWPSVVDKNIEEKDFRTDHEALPVTKGIKFAANSWIHTRNYREAEKKDCT